MLTGRPGLLSRVSGDHRSQNKWYGRGRGRYVSSPAGARARAPSPAPSSATTNGQPRLGRDRPSLLVLPRQLLHWVRSPLVSPSSPPHVTSFPLSSSVTPGAAAHAANPPPPASHWLVRSRASGIAPAHAGRAAPPCGSLPAPAGGGGQSASEARASRRPLPPPRACSCGGWQPRPRTRTGPLPSARARVASRSVSRRSPCSSGIFLGRTRTAPSAAVPRARPRRRQ